MTYLSDKDIILFEVRFYDLLIESFGVKIIARASLNWIWYVPHNHIKPLFSFLQLSPLFNRNN